MRHAKPGARAPHLARRRAAAGVDAGQAVAGLLPRLYGHSAHERGERGRDADRGGVGGLDGRGVLWGGRAGGGGWGAGA